MLLDMQLNLYEHQSTVNPNMPLRDLIYVSHLYEAMFREDELYNSVKVVIPTPKFVVFYNGSRRQPERSTLYLSDLYAQKEGKENLELRVLQLNISKGFNEELKKKCPTLMGYMQYVEKVRNYTGTMPLREAVERSVEECIKEDILVSFFRRNRAEAIHVSITQYNQEAHMARIAEINRKKGRESVNQLFQRLLVDERMEDLRRSVTDPDFQMQLLKEYGLWNDE